MTLPCDASPADESRSCSPACGGACPCDDSPGVVIDTGFPGPEARALMALASAKAPKLTRLTESLFPDDQRPFLPAPPGPKGRGAG